MLRQIVISNRAQCAHCQEIIESKHVHDYRPCKCGAISVDGGLEYLRRAYQKDGDIIELSEILNIEKIRLEKIRETVELANNRAEQEAMKTILMALGIRL